MTTKKDSNTVKCKLLRDRWNEKGQRIKKGTLVDIPVAEAMKLVRDRLAEPVEAGAEPVGTDGE